MRAATRPSRRTIRRQAGYAPVGHGSASQQTVTDKKGASVRIAWSDSAAYRQLVDDLIAYLLSL